MDGWITIVSFWDGLFSGAFAVSFRECKNFDKSSERGHDYFGLPGPGDQLVSKFIKCPKKVAGIQHFFLQKGRWLVIELPFHVFILLLLMEEILHHLGCMNLANNRINYQSTGAGFQPSTVVKAVFLSKNLKISPHMFCKNTWSEKIPQNFLEFNSFHWDVLLVLRINGLFHPYKGRLDKSRK